MTDDDEEDDDDDDDDDDDVGWEDRGIYLSGGNGARRRRVIANDANVDDG